MNNQAYKPLMSYYTDNVFFSSELKQVELVFHLEQYNPKNKTVRVFEHVYNDEDMSSQVYFAFRSIEKMHEKCGQKGPIKFNGEGKFTFLFSVSIKNWKELRELNLSLEEIKVDQQFQERRLAQFLKYQEEHGGNCCTIF